MGRVNAERDGVGCRREKIRAKFYVANPRFNSPKSRSVNRRDNAEAFCRTWCGVVGRHLGDQEHLAPLPCDDVSDHLLGTTVSINLGRVDKCQA